MFNKVREMLLGKRDLDDIKNSLGRIESYLLKDEAIENSGFKVYSQWDEDGIIQYLIRHVEIERPIFIEFGVENYMESNTRFLLINNNWSGLVIDGSKRNIEDLKKQNIFWRHKLKAVNQFITKDNINEIFLENGLSGDIGILSIDIDGNDYWIWKAIDSIQPRIVILEYNSLFGMDAKVTTPYDAAFVRNDYHYSFLVYGASIAALCGLAEEKGYSLVAGNYAGNNVFFVRNDLMGDLQRKSIEEIYRPAQFREARDAKGKLTFADEEGRKKAVEDVYVYDLEKERNVQLKEIFAGGGGLKNDCYPCLVLLIGVWYTRFFEWVPVCSIYRFWMRFSFKGDAPGVSVV